MDVELSIVQVDSRKLELIHKTCEEIIVITLGNVAGMVAAFFCSNKSTTAYSMKTKIAWQELQELSAVNIYQKIYKEFMEHVSENSEYYIGSDERIPYASTQIIKRYKRRLEQVN